MFYTFKQNNSGGWFDIDDNVAVNVIIEANSAEEANQLAQQHGIYFDGVAEGQDCPCCGDRWAEVRESDGKELPVLGAHAYRWTAVGAPVAHIIFLDGTKESIIKESNDESVS